MIELYIIRHGQTIENINNICQGQGVGRLSELGKKQARLLGKRLKDETFDLLYSSDLERAVITASEILEYHPGLEMKTTPVLREWSLTSWEGKPFPKKWSWNDLPEGAETTEDMVNRAAAFIEMLLEKHDGKRIAAVTHGGLIRAFWTVIARKTASALFDWKVPENTSISRVLLQADGKHELLDINNAEHLMVDC